MVTQSSLSDDTSYIGKKITPSVYKKKSTALETSVTLAEKQGGKNNDTLGLKSSGWQWLPSIRIR